MKYGKFGGIEVNMVILEFRDGEVKKFLRSNYPDDIKQGDTFYINYETGEFAINKYKRDWDRIYLKSLFADENELG
jgi:hypothetical protein